MLVETIQQNLMSSQLADIKEGLDQSIIYPNLLNDENLLNQEFSLLEHEDYQIRQITEKALRFNLTSSSEICHKIVKGLELLISAENTSEDCKFRCIRLLSSISLKHGQAQILVNALTTSEYPQGLSVFLLRKMCRDYSEIVDYILKLEEIEFDKEFEIGQFDRKSDMLKSICWIFWSNPIIFNQKVMKFLFGLSSYEDSEVRRLSCEVLGQMIGDKRYGEQIQEKLESMVTDESWRVQKAAIVPLLERTISKEDDSYSDRIIGLFWDTAWQVRMNICEAIPSRLSLSKQQNEIFKEILSSSVFDSHWEVREKAIKSLHRYLDFTKQENKEILKKITLLWKDPHAQVRRQCCTFLSDLFENYLDKSEVISIFFELCMDKHWEVKLEAIEGLRKILSDRILTANIETLITIVLNLLREDIPEVREKLWILADDIRKILVEKESLTFIGKIVRLFEVKEPIVRLKACEFIQQCLYIWEKNIIEFLNNSDLKEVSKGVRKLIRDEDTQVSECAWKIVLENNIIFNDLILSASLMIEEMDYSGELFIKILECFSQNQNIFIENPQLSNILITSLKQKDVSPVIKARILNLFYSNQKDLLTSDILIELSNDGQWKVQIALIPFLIDFLLEDSEKRLDSSVNTQILSLLKHPLEKIENGERSNEKIPENILDQLNKSLSEDVFNNNSNHFNQDIRLEYWKDLENKLDYFEKINHQSLTDLFDTLQVRLREMSLIQGRSILEYLTDRKVTLKTVSAILDDLLKQQGKVREVLLTHLLSVLDSNGSIFEKYKTTLLYLFSDPSFKIRKLIMKYFVEAELEKLLLHEMTNQLDSDYLDLRSYAVSYLFRNLDFLDQMNEPYLNRIMTKLSDPNFIIRNQVWEFIRSNIKFSLPRYKKLIPNIFQLYNKSKNEIRKEIVDIIDSNFEIFLHYVNEYPVSKEIYHVVGYLLNIRGDFARSLEFFNKVLTIDPTDLNGKLSLALVYLDSNRVENAIRILENLQKEYPYEYKVYQLLVESMIEMKDDSGVDKYQKLSKYFR